MLVSFLWHEFIEQDLIIVFYVLKFIQNQIRQEEKYNVKAF